MTRASRAIMSPLVLSAVGGQAAVRGAGLIRDLVIARRLGVGPVLDPYLFAMAVQSLAFGTVVSIIPIVMVPAFSRAEVHLTRQNVAVIVTGSLAFGGSGLLITRLTDSLTWLLVGLALSIFAVCGSGVLSSKLVSSGRVLVAVMPGLSLAAIPIAVVFSVGSTLRAADLVGAIIAGSMLELLLLALLCWSYVQSSGGGLRRAIHRVEVVALAATSIVSTVRSSVDLAVVRSLGSDAVSIFTLASRIPIGLSSVLVPAVSAVVMPLASQEVRDVRSWPHEWTTIRSRARLAAGLTAGVAVLLIVATPLLNQLLFAGSKMDAGDVSRITQVQVVLCVTIPIYVSGTLLVRYLQAARMHAAVTRIGLVAALVGSGAALVSASTLGLVGVAAASVLGYAVSLVLLIRLGSRMAAVKWTGEAA